MVRLCIFTSILKVCFFSFYFLYLTFFFFKKKRKNLLLIVFVVVGSFPGKAVGVRIGGKAIVPVESKEVCLCLLTFESVVILNIDAMLLFKF